MTKQSPPYKVAVIFLHPGCNMTCNFCITENNFDAIAPAQAADLLIRLKDEGFESVVFGGGEPFTWPGDLIALTQEAKQKGFIVQVGTNAVDLPEGFETIATIDRYVLPLESVDPRVHNQMRFYKQKHHQIILNCLERLKVARKSVTISTIVTKINHHEIKALATFLSQMNDPNGFIHAWHLYMFLPEGRGGHRNALDLLLCEDDFERVVKEVKEMGLSFPVFKRKDMYCSQTVDFFWVQDSQLVRGSIFNKTRNASNQKLTVPFTDTLNVVSTLKEEGREEFFYDIILSKKK